MADLTGMLAASAGNAGAETDPNFNQTVLLLHGDGTNGAQNNTFLDSSTNNFTITRNGNTTQGTFSPFSLPDGRWANALNGTTDYLSIADNAALEIGASQFCIEMFVYLNALPASGSAYTLISKFAGSPDRSWIFNAVNNSGTMELVFGYTTDGSNTVLLTQVNASGLTAGAWHHVAVTRDASNDFRYFLNGTQCGSDIAFSATIANTSQAIEIGRHGAAIQYINGYVSNVRLVIGSPIYTSAFTPSTSPLTTTSQGASSSEVELLACQSNRFVDNSSNAFAITPNGGAKVTPFSPFAPTAAYDASVNGGSGYFDGTGDYLTAADNAAFDFDAAFTIEGWLYLNASTNAALIDTRNLGSDGYTLSFTTGELQLVKAGTEILVTTAKIQLNSWTHFVAVRDASNNISLFLNGSRDGATTNSGTWDCATTFHFGAKSLGGSSLVPINGYVSNFRIVKGTAVYDPTSTTITVPTSPLTAVSGTSLLLNFTNAGIFDNTGKNNLETVGNAQVDTTTKKYGTGSMEFDGTGDTILIPPSINNLLITATNFTLEFWYKFASAPGSNQYAYSVRYNGDNYLYIYATSSGWVFDSYTTGTQGPKITSSSLTHDTTTFHHFALVYDSGTYKMFVDGTSVGSQANSSVLTAFNGFAISLPYYISGRANIDSYFNGYIDDLRITKGVARYTSAFTPPTKAFPDL